MNDITRRRKARKSGKSFVHGYRWAAFRSTPAPAPRPRPSRQARSTRSRSLRTAAAAFAGGGDHARSRRQHQAREVQDGRRQRDRGPRQQAGGRHDARDLARQGQRRIRDLGRSLQSRRRTVALCCVDARRRDQTRPHRAEPLRGPVVRQYHPRLRGPGGRAAVFDVVTGRESGRIGEKGGLGLAFLSVAAAPCER